MATVLSCCPSCSALAAPHATWCSLCFTSLIEPEPETPPEPDLAPVSDPRSTAGERAGDDDSTDADLDFSALKGAPALGRWSGADLSVGAKLAIGGLGMLLLMALILGGLTVIGVLFL